MVRRATSGFFDCVTCGAVQAVDQMKVYNAADIIVSGLWEGTPLSPQGWLCKDCAAVVDEFLEEYD